MRRNYLQLYDKSSAGGTVVDGMEDAFNEGVPLTYLGAKVVCPACKTTGRIVPRGPRWPNDWMGKEMAMDGDLCVCKCDPPPIMIASQNAMFDEFQVHDLASMGFGPTGMPLPKAAPLKEATKSSFKETDQKSTLPDDPVLICPNMTNAEFAELVMRLCAELVTRTEIRLGELQRWSAQDQRNVMTWFGIAGQSTRRKLFDGLNRMLHVFKSLTPENFVRYSETALQHVGCVPKPRANKREVAAAVCKTDTATHTIAIALSFCTLRDDSDRVDSQILTLAHEVSHFIDTLDTEDEEYRIWNAIALARKKSPICIKNADNVAAYIVVHDQNIPDNFGTSIIQF